MVVGNKEGFVEILMNDKVVYSNNKVTGIPVYKNVIFFASDKYHNTLKSIISKF